MEHIVTIALISASALLGAGVGLDWVFRGLNKKRTDHRMGQALRRGLANPEGVRNGRMRIVQWQACDSTSVRWS